MSWLWRLLFVRRFDAWTLAAAWLASHFVAAGRPALAWLAFVVWMAGDIFGEWRVRGE